MQTKWNHNALHYSDINPEHLQRSIQEKHYNKDHRGNQKKRSSSPYLFFHKQNESCLDVREGEKKPSWGKLALVVFLRRRWNSNREAVSNGL